MADSIISFLMDNLTQLLKQEANLLLGVGDEVRSLCAELRLMNCFLRSFKGRHDEQDITNELVGQLRDIAHEAEDVIDTYVANVAQERGENLLGKWKHQFVGWKTRHDVGKKIESIRKRIEKIHTDKDRFGIQITQAGETSTDQDTTRRRTRLPIAEEDEVVGLDHDTKMIINRLTNGKPGLHVVPIVGMGGLGKTTLARKVYNDLADQNHFNFRAWVYVSKEYKEKELLLAILKCAMVITDEMKEKNEADLRMTLRTFLRSTKYLIVLDDVWKPGCWDELSEIFVNNLHGSRIIITTRNKDVAFHANPSGTPYYLGFLTSGESWELLSKKVFRGGSNCTPELEDTGKKIAEKCRGLPLAIVVVAGLLTKREHSERLWEKVLSKVGSFGTDEDTQQCMEILALSYDDLPHHLKWCFLYFGVFLEDFEISTRQVIQLWIAEGFVKQNEGEPMEDSAEEYLEKLIDRNLIQAVKSRFDGRVKACRIHDLLRDLCILKANEENFLEVRGNVSPSSPSTSRPSNSRRLAIHSNTLRYMSSNPSTSKVRSFLCFGGLDEGQLSSQHWKFLYRGFTLLRVLDLWDVVVDNIPSEIEKLIHLRYVRLRSHTARSLPASICNLWNLQTFEVKAPLIDRPQIGIWKMQQLRHLYFHGQAVLPEPRVQCDALSSVQTLSSISPDSCTKRILSRFPNLVKLGIYGDLNQHMGNKSFNSISILEKLKTLKLERDRRFESLSSLNWVKIPANITKLTLSETQLSSDPMPELGKLPKLRVLKLTNDAYVGSGLYCSGEFPQLKVLNLINLGIKTWVIYTGMASLQSIVISRCSNLEGLPSALQNVSTLREMKLWWPNSLVLRDSKTIQKLTGNDRLKLTIYNSEA